jgi:hypothetical protein
MGVGSQPVGYYYLHSFSGYILKGCSLGESQMHRPRGSRRWTAPEQAETQI